MLDNFPFDEYIKNSQTAHKLMLVVASWKGLDNLSLKKQLNLMQSIYNVYDSLGLIKKKTENDLFIVLKALCNVRYNVKFHKKKHSGGKMMDKSELNVLQNIEYFMMRISLYKDLSLADRDLERMSLLIEDYNDH